MIERASIEQGPNYSNLKLRIISSILLLVVLITLLNQLLLMDYFTPTSPILMKTEFIFITALLFSIAFLISVKKGSWFFSIGSLILALFLIHISGNIPDTVGMNFGPTFYSVLASVIFFIVLGYFKLSSRFSNKVCIIIGSILLIILVIMSVSILLKINQNLKIDKEKCIEDPIKKSKYCKVYIRGFLGAVLPYDIYFSLVSYKRCDRAPNEIARDHCLDLFALVKDDPELCDKIKDITEKFLCYDVYEERHDITSIDGAYTIRLFNDYPQLCNHVSPKYQHRCNNTAKRLGLA